MTRCSIGSVIGGASSSSLVERLELYVLRLRSGRIRKCSFVNRENLDRVYELRDGGVPGALRTVGTWVCHF